MKNEITKAGHLPKIQDPQHPAYWSEAEWIDLWINENPEVLLKLEIFKNYKIQKYEEESKKIGGYEEL